MTQTLLKPIFAYRQIVPSLVVCEASVDVHGWNNTCGDLPAFLTYIGYNLPEERDILLYQLRTFFGITEPIADRCARRVKGYAHELKVWGLSRHSDPSVFSIEYMSESKHYGLDFLARLLGEY